MYDELSNTKKKIFSGNSDNIIDDSDDESDSGEDDESGHSSDGNERSQTRRTTTRGGTKIVGARRRPMGKKHKLMGIEHCLKPWLFEKSKLLYLSEILNTLNEISINSGKKLNLKVLNINIGQNREEESSEWYEFSEIFYHLWYKKEYNNMLEICKNYETRKYIYDDAINNYSYLNDIHFNYKKIFNLLKKYIDCGNVIIKIPKFDNLQILKLGNIVGKVDMSNYINSNPLLLLNIQNMIPMQFINNTNNNNNNINNNSMICDCLIINNHEALPYFEEMWIQMVKQRCSLNDNIMNKNIDSNSKIVNNSNKFEIKPLFFGSKGCFKYAYNIPNIMNIDNTETDIIKEYWKQGLINKNIFFVQINTLDKLFLRLIKYRFNGFDNNIINDVNSIYNYNLKRYKKWFEMGLLDWINDMRIEPHSEKILPTLRKVKRRTARKVVKNKTLHRKSMKRNVL